MLLLSENNVNITLLLKTLFVQSSLNEQILVTEYLEVCLSGRSHGIETKSNYVFIINFRSCKLIKRNLKGTNPIQILTLHVSKKSACDGCYFTNYTIIHNNLVNQSQSTNRNPRVGGTTQ